jgi:SPP1 gp7 family putative phage head morphogenesis protein
MPQIVTKGPNPLPIREARLAPIQKRMGGKLKAYFQDLQTQSLRTMRGSKAMKALDGGTLYDREKSQADLRLIVRTYIGETGKAAYAASAEDFNLSVNWSDQAPWVEQHMGKRLPLIDGIDATTVTALSDSLAEGATAGETMNQLADRVSAVFSDAIDNRAETIARTETIQAYGSASIQSYREAGVQVQMYDGSGDPECAAVNGMIVSPDEADALMAAEHPNGTRGCAPLVDLGFREDGTQTAGWFRFDNYGVAVA